MRFPLSIKWRKTHREAMDAKQAVEGLLAYGLSRGLIADEDVVETRNYLLDLLHLPEPAEVTIPSPDIPVPESPEAAVAPLVDYAAAAGLIPDTATNRELFDTRLMGVLTPRSSQVIAKFVADKEEYGVMEALDRYYQFSQDTLYIRMERIKKNIEWLSPSKYGDLQITINLSKPEKDPRDIAAARNAPTSGYPKCVLCLENVGYAGRVNHPARQNHRVLPLTLSGKQWYFQYSPYVYYHQHCIVFRSEHVPMRISRETFQNFFDFLHYAPHYFIGSNADLPIVGGSILSHDHYQGGFHRFPMDTATSLARLHHAEFADIEAIILNWPVSTLRLRCEHSEPLVDVAEQILAAWREYSDPTVEVLAYSLGPDGQRIPHNTITPIARRSGDGRFELDLVFRNNRTSAEHPLGIFHPHSELHHIKKENIGLIEVMGLAILPGRLEAELGEIAKLLTGEAPMTADREEKLSAHLPWIQELMKKYGDFSLDSDGAKRILQMEVGNKFASVLEDAGVFKLTEEGQGAFLRFLESCGFTPTR